jgi:hypothetical protein
MPTERRAWREFLPKPTIKRVTRENGTLRNEELDLAPIMQLSYEERAALLGRLLRRAVRTTQKTAPKWTTNITLHSFDVHHDTIQLGVDGNDNIEGLLEVVRDYVEAFYCDISKQLSTHEEREDLVGEMAAHRLSILEWLKCCGDVLNQGDAKAAMLVGLELGAMLQWFAVIGDSYAVARGRAQIKGTKIGHEAAHGNTQEKAARYDDYQKQVDQLRAKNSRISYSAACRKVAARFSVSEKTVRNHTKK